MKIKFVNLLFYLLLSISLILNACSINNANNYPLLVDDGGSGQAGMHKNQAGDSWSFSILFIRNIGNDSITINNVSLIDAIDMSIVETSLMEIGEEKTLLGVQKWPIVLTDEFPHFNSRIPAEGAVIEPGDAYNLILAVKSQANKAYTSGLKIVYKDAKGKQYVQESHYAYALDDTLIE
ncbi:hypothetical protein OXPF_00180 [Oxobacter pfennigii]|uniref:Telomeric repeat-binding factor 2 n=1 Tax=Oxobacter pfennigii TaxID=36849 RepID=A0A0N8NU16_9CLOT|nr:hypothetical protein [Oxobacter pfennigii]KPU46376.1 hypothetical protein OXPF_00180 [Oxobacter pfennigii]